MPCQDGIGSFIGFSNQCHTGETLRQTPNSPKLHISGGAPFVERLQLGVQSIILWIHDSKQAAHIQL